MSTLGNILLLAAEEGGKEDSGGSFLVSPGLGLMIWTLIAFGSALLILRKYAFPAIGEAIDKRAAAINESIEAAGHEEDEQMARKDVREQSHRQRDDADGV